MGVAFVGIPIYTLTKYRPMAEAVRNLREAGIVTRIKSAADSLDDLGDVVCPSIEHDRGPENVKNFEAFLEATRNVRSRLAEQTNSSRLTFCLGGECSFVPGVLAGLKKTYGGRPGMVWLDAHGDFNTPSTSPSGFIGGMPLALACGRGPKLSMDIESQRPLLDERQVVHVGSRSLDPGEKEALQRFVRIFSAKEVKKKGSRGIARQIAGTLNDSSDWIVAHLDIDVFDPAVMSAVDFPEPGGLTIDEVLEIFRGLRSTGKLKVIDLTAYNPLMDKDGVGRSKLLDLTPKLLGHD